MRSEDRSATCCHHRCYHLCRKDNNNNLINKRYEQNFFFFRSLQPIQAPHRRLHRRRSRRFFLCCCLCRSCCRIVSRTQRPTLRKQLGLDRLALHTSRRYHRRHSSSLNSSLTMDAKEIQKRIVRLKDDIEREVRDRLPRKVGIVAVNHFKQNFRDAGWRDDGLHPWKTTQRQREGGPDAKYTPLTSRRDHLMRSIQYSSQPGQVTVTNPVPYAAIHNNGGTLNTHPSVTKRMRRFAWAKVYALAGVKGKGKLPKQLPATAAKWRALALTKKSKLSITARIPQRQFMGDSRELKQKINTIINDSVKRIENGILNI